MTSDQFLELKCSSCGHSEVCGPQQMLAKLRDCGMFKREKEPDLVLVQELFAAQATEFSCGECQARTMVVEVLEDWDDEDWGEARSCERCGEPIAVERLEVFPDTRMCTACQQSMDRGVDDDEPDFCPRCGAIMELRMSRRTGTSQYIMHCRECGNRA